MLRKILAISSLISVTAMLPTTTHAATDTAASSAVVLTPITITKTIDMSFGDMFPTAAAGTVVLGTDDSLTHTNVTAGPTGGTAATFTVGGSEGSTYAITLPANITLVSGGNNMIVDTFTHNAGGTPTIGVGGTSTLKVGGTLNVGATQAAGSYSVNFDVTVDYN
ncbi:MAG: DUF4402 domain-containing protein [Gammaproteobacteria bacterium]|nr:DUF4402 domain-containing protein [Gammaproteobacteria bacterium]